MHPPMIAHPAQERHQVVVAEALTKLEIQEDLEEKAAEAEAVTDKIHLQQVQLEAQTLAVAEEVEDYLLVVEPLVVVVLL